MTKITNEYELLPLLKQYILEINSGNYLKPNGKPIKKSSIQNYLYLQKLLFNYSQIKNFKLRVKILNPKNKDSFETEKKYWRDFYKGFTDYLYEDLGHFDNYVSANTKLLKAFLNYLKAEKGYSIGNFHNKLLTSSEEIEIVVLSPERLNTLIHSTILNDILSATLLKVKDVFVFGCAVGLRYSDLMNIKSNNIEHVNGNIYLKVQSKKTQTFTRVKLPIYAIQILEKYKSENETNLLPYFNKVFLNKKIKQLMEIAGFTEPAFKTRQKRGIPTPLHRKNKEKVFRFCDLVTTHTMRRTAITTMLSFGMNEQVVRKISGHAAGSKEFYRYVSFAQTYLDTEIDLVHKKLEKQII